VQAVVLDKMERYLEIEEILPGSELIWKKPKDSAFTINAIEDAEKAAKKLRSLWHLGDDPIPFMAELLEEQGIKVISLDLPVDVSGSKAFVKTKQQDEKPIVVVNSKHNAVRQRFTLAHELAHLILDIPNKNILNEEKVADRFAGAFLMVKEAIVKLVGVSRSSFTIGELAELTKIFKVSIASLVVRCGQLNILSKASYGILFGRLIKLGLTGPVSKEPIAFAAEVPQRMERMCLRAVAEHIISESKAAELLQMNIRDFDKLMMVRGV
jgi:Zn-dependent peptidase ImmA (M78 family)